MAQYSDVLDYELIGDDLQAVIVTLDPGETVIAEAGAMMFMEHGIEMNTTLDPNKQGGGMFGKLFAGAKRALSGDTFFITTFANGASSRRRVAFSSPFPGKIKPVDLREWNGTIIAQKDAFLCAPRGTNVDIAFTRRRTPGAGGKHARHRGARQRDRRRPGRTGLNCGRWEGGKVGRSNPTVPPSHRPSQGVAFTGGLPLKSPARTITILDWSRYFLAAAFTWSTVSALTAASNFASYAMVRPV